MLDLQRKFNHFSDKNSPKENVGIKIFFSEKKCRNKNTIFFNINTLKISIIRNLYGSTKCRNKKLSLRLFLSE